jgi:hypothetical protein
MTRYRTELALLAVLLAGNDLLGPIIWWAIVLVTLAIPQPRRWIARRLQISRVRRHVTRALEDASLTATPGRVGALLAGDSVQVRIGRGQHLGKLQAAAATLAVSLRVREVRVIPDRNDASRASLILVRRDPFDVAERIPWPLADAKAVDLWQPFPVGVDENGEPVTIELLKADRGAASLLIGGVPGAGKSVKLAIYAAAAAMFDGCDVWLMDGKEGLELRDWKDSAVELARTRASAIMMLRKLKGVMEDTFAVLGEHDLKMITPGCGIRPQVLICDELAVYVLAEDAESKKRAKEVTELLRDLVARGRAAGIITIFATQRPDASTIDTRLRDLITYRDAMRCMNRQSSDMLLPDWSSEGVDASSITNAQRGVSFLLAEGERPLRVRGYYLDAVEVAALAKRATERRSRPVGAVGVVPAAGLPGAAQDPERASSDGREDGAGEPP